MSHQKQRHLFRYKFVSDNDGSVQRFQNKADVRLHFQLTKWHLDHAIIVADAYRAEMGGVLSQIHEDRQGNAVTVRHVDARFSRSSANEQKETSVELKPVGGTHRGADNFSERRAAKPWPFLRMYKKQSQSRPV